MSLASPHAADAADLGAVTAGDAVRVAREVDLRPGLELAVEDDGEVLGVGRVARVACAIGLALPALGEDLRDLLEAPLALVREVHQHDGLAGGGVEVGPRIADLGSGERLALGWRAEEVPQQLPLLAVRGLPGAAAAGVARGRDESAGHLEYLGIRAPGRLDRVEHGLRARLGSGQALLRLLVEGVELARVLRRFELLLLGGLQHLVQRGARHGCTARGRPRHDRHEVLLHVQEDQLRGALDDARRLLRILDAGKADHDPVTALLADLRLGHAERVDTIADDSERRVHLRVGHLLPGLGHGLQGHLEAALQIEPEHGLLDDRRDADPHQRSENDEEGEEVASSVGHVAVWIAFSAWKRLACN